MRIGKGDNSYQWIDNWAKSPKSDGWAHHGVAITEAGHIIACHQEKATIQTFDSNGNLLSSWESGLTEAHGITIVKEGATEYLWIADTGRKRLASLSYEQYEDSPQVVKFTLDGQRVMNIRQPDLPIYDSNNYSPTWVAVNEERNGGNGDIWVADGYGASCIHRYDKLGKYISTINGEEGDAGLFKCPHSIFVDTRKSNTELYIADRTNGRVQVYDVEGNFKRVFGSDFFTSPSGFAIHGNLMIVAELKARLVILNIDDEPVEYLGSNIEVAEVEGWPNNVNEKGEPVPTAFLRPGKFNSPHGLAVDKDKNLYVAEWLIGGRFTKLKKI